MRFLFVLCLGLLSTFTFGQAPLSIQDMPRLTASADIPIAAKLTSDNGQASVSGQQTSTPVNLFDAPSATPRSTCTERNGKPCPEWLHKLIGQYPPIDVRERWNGQPDHFFAIGKGRRVLHPDKKSWMLFAVAHAGMWASTVVAVRDYPSSKEKADSEYPAVAFLTGMDLLVFKTFSPALPDGPPAYAMIHYSRAATK
jgi:hypothetical protein